MMKIYFFDENNRYIGNRELAEGELIPQNATTKIADVGDYQEGYLVNEEWVINNITDQVNPPE